MDMLHLCEVFGLDSHEIALQTSKILFEETGEDVDIYNILQDDNSSLTNAIKKVEELKAKSANVEDANLRAFIMSEVADMKVLN